MLKYRWIKNKTSPKFVNTKYIIKIDCKLYMMFNFINLPNWCRPKLWISGKFCSVSCSFRIHCSRSVQSYRPENLLFRYIHYGSRLSPISSIRWITSGSWKIILNLYPEENHRKTPPLPPFMSYFGPDAVCSWKS